MEGGAGSPLFFNKTTNLVYGEFLKEFPDARILAVKKPSFIRKVRYADIVRELYEAFVSLQSEEDKHVKKQIANCIIGLLEKTHQQEPQELHLRDVPRGQVLSSEIRRHDQLREAVRGNKIIRHPGSWSGLRSASGDVPRASG